MATEDNDALRECRERLEEAQLELAALRERVSVLERELAEKDEELSAFRTGAPRSIRQASVRVMSKANDRLYKSEALRELTIAVRQEELLTEILWRKVMKETDNILPSFSHLVSSKKQFLDENHYRCCVLLRLGVKATAISHLLGVTPQYVTKMCYKLSNTLFGKCCGSRQLAKKLSEIC